MKYYSPSTLGFYDTELHGKKIPSDAVALTDEEHHFIINNQRSDKVIAVENGKVVLKDRVYTQEDLINQFNEKRKNSYPSTNEQLDMLWHMMDDGEIPGKGSKWYNTILEVKNKHPK